MGAFQRRPSGLAWTTTLSMNGSFVTGGPPVFLLDEGCNPFRKYGL
jgi:hypothetical protein